MTELGYFVIDYGSGRPPFGRTLQVDWPTADKQLFKAGKITFDTSTQYAPMSSTWEQDKQDPADLRLPRADLYVSWGAVSSDLVKMLESGIDVAHCEGRWVDLQTWKGFH